MSRKKRETMENAVEQGPISKRPEYLGLRLPPGMKEQIAEAAAQDRRTITSWVEHQLAEALERSKKARKN